MITRPASWLSSSTLTSSILPLPIKVAGRGSSLWRGSASVTEVIALVGRFLGPARAAEAFAGYAAQRGLTSAAELVPDADLVHFAEQRAAPYSMKSSATKRYTVDNNVNGTHNLLAAIVDGRITDVKTIVGIHWLQLHLAGQWPARLPPR